MALISASNMKFSVEIMLYNEKNEFQFRIFPVRNKFFPYAEIYGSPEEPRRRHTKYIEDKIYLACITKYLISLILYDCESHMEFIILTQHSAFVRTFS